MISVSVPIEFTATSIPLTALCNIYKGGIIAITVDNPDPLVSFSKHPTIFSASKSVNSFLNEHR